MDDRRVRWPWAHFAYGGSRVAWCNSCDTLIVSFSLGANTEGLPRATRKKIDEHLAECNPTGQLVA